MSSNPHGNLSLFSGMTFSSDTSDLQSISSDNLDRFTGDDQQDGIVHGMHELQELKEVFENFDFKLKKGDAEVKERDFRSENENRHKITQEKEHQQGTPATVKIPLSQHAKKKKKTQAKRPGYARDNPVISHPKPGATGGRHGTALKPSSVMLKTHDVSSIVSKAEKADEVQSVLPSQDEPECMSLKDQEEINEYPFLNKAEGKAGGEDTQNIFSIDTPSSSEENLFDIGKEQQQDGYRRESSEKLQGENEPKEILDTENTKIEAIHDSETLEMDLESTKESKDSTVETNSSKVDGITLKENIPSTFVPLNKERVETFCEDIKSKTIKDQKETQKTYDLKLDAEEKTLLVEQDVQFRISSLREKEEILQKLEYELLQNYSDLSSTFLDKEREMDNITQEETNALAHDNYDLAEELNAKIEELKESLEKAKYKLPASDIKVQHALQLKTELFLKRLSILQETQITLEELKEEQASSLDVFIAENTAKISKERQRLNTEQLRLERLYAHLKLDTEHLRKEETMLEDEISQRIEKLVQRKKLLIEERENIREEISEVEIKLERLRIREADWSKNIEVEKLKINEIVEEFSPQKEPLIKERIQLEKQQELLNTDQESLYLAQERLNKLDESWSNKKHRITELLDGLQETLKSNTMSIDVLEKQRREIEEYLFLKHLSCIEDTTLEKLRSSVKQKSQQIKSLTSKRSLSERSITSLKKKLGEFENQISDRNEAKDIAKKERNFREAKRLKEEAEALKAEGIECQGQLESLVEEHTQNIVLLQTKEKEFRTIKKELEAKEHESDLKLINSAAMVMKVLQEEVSRYVDNEFLHTLLTAEISTCQNLLNELCSKHRLSAPVIEDIQPQDDTMQSDNEVEIINEEIDDTSCSEHSKTGDEESKSILGNEGTEQELLDQLDVLEGKLEAMVDMEDFDEADRIQQEIIQLKSKFEERS